MSLRGIFMHRCHGSMLAKETTSEYLSLGIMDLSRKANKTWKGMFKEKKEE